MVPFLEAIDKYFAFLQAAAHRHVQRRHRCTPVSIPPTTYFPLFNEKNNDLHHLVKDFIVEGPDLIFHRYQEKTVTKLHRNDYIETAQPCRSVVGYNANGLYLWAFMQDMPNFFPSQRSRTDGSLYPAPWLPVYTTRGEHHQGATQGLAPHRNMKEHRLPASLCHGRRAMGIRVERGKKRSGRETVSRRRVPRNVTADRGRRACRYSVLSDRVRRPRNGEIARLFRRDATRVQERQRDPR